MKLFQHNLWSKAARQRLWKQLQLLVGYHNNWSSYYYEYYQTYYNNYTTSYHYNHKSSNNDNNWKSDNQR